MNPEFPQTPREELEARVTALLLGELNDEETARLHQALEQDAELRAQYERLKLTIELVREVTANPVEQTGAAAAPLRLSSERREQLLARFKTVAPQEFTPKLEAKRKVSWLIPISAAAAAVVIVAGIALPTFNTTRSTSRLKTVMNELQLLEGAKQQWALENKKSGEDVPTFEELKPYFGRSGNVTLSLPDERYVLGKVSEPVVVEVDDPVARRIASVITPMDRGPVGDASTSVTPDTPTFSAGYAAIQDGKMNDGVVPADTAVASEGTRQPGLNLYYSLDENSHDQRAGETQRAASVRPNRPPTEPAQSLLSLGKSVVTVGATEQERVSIVLPSSGPVIANRGMVTDEGQLGGLHQAVPGQSAAQPRFDDPATGQSSSQVLVASGYDWYRSQQSAGFKAIGGSTPATPPVGSLGGRGRGEADATLAEGKFGDDFIVGNDDRALDRLGGLRAFGGVMNSSGVAPGDQPMLESASQNELNWNGRWGSYDGISTGKALDGVELRLQGATEALVAVPTVVAETSGIASGNFYVTAGANLFAETPPDSARDKGVALVTDLDGTLPGIQSRFSSITNGDTTMNRATAEPEARERLSQSGVQTNFPTAETFAPAMRLALAKDASGESSTRAIQDSDPLRTVPAVAPPLPQPEVSSRDNRYSTFSLNVSDVSFQLAAASLEQGVMPEPASIRSEEFINAFDYRDPQPPPGAAIAFASERARYPFAHNRDLLRFSIKTAAAGREAGRPLNLVLLLDNSGSMERADRLRIIQHALTVLAAQLQPQDRLSVVTFARTATLRVDGTSGDQASNAVARVIGLTPEGGTNLEDALNVAYHTALRHYASNGVNRVVLLTDGAANLGEVNPDSLKRNVEAHRRQGIALDCFGIGWDGYNDDLLEALSRNGDGRYGFINTPEEAASGFVRQLSGALQVAASDVKVQVEFNPARVNAYRQIGYARHQLTKQQFRDNTVDAAEIGAAESGNGLYVVDVNPGGQGPVATVRVRFRVPGTAEYREQEWTVPYTGSAMPLEQASSALRLAATASAFSEWLAGNPFAGEVTTDRLLNLLNGVPETFGADERPKKLEWMIRQAQAVGGR